MIYFTADWYLGHNNTVRYCERPFKDGNAMDKTLIHNHNSIVTKDDIVYMVGDYSLKSAEHRLWIEKVTQKLNGQLHLILGNHDRLNPFIYEEIGFASVHTWLKVEEFILVHDPAKACLFPNNIVLTGHIHNLFKKVKNVVNVGVDVWDFKPVSIERVRTFIAE